MIKNVVGGAAALVSFELPSSVSADSVSVCGDFNDWAPGAQPLARLEGGGFRAVLELPTGRRWRFRYLLDGGRWENDWAADDYIPNQHGSHDSVVDLTTGALPSASAEPTPEPAAAVSDSEVTEVAEVAEIVPAARPRTRKRVAAESSGSVAGAPKTSARTRKAVAAPAAEPQAGVDAVPVAAGATTSRKRKPRKATE
jgi:hypothetical protein